MGSPLPPVTPLYHTGTPVSISNNKIKKGQNHTCTFHLHPSDRHTNLPTCMTVAPDALYLFTKFEP